MTTFHVIFHSFGGGGIMGSVSVCYVVCVMKYALFHVSYLSWF